MPKVTEQYREDQRAQILDAARRCFLRSGFHRTTLQDVIAESGRSAGALYGYFASKDQMIEAIATQNLQGITDALHEILADEARSLTPGEAVADLMQEALTRQKNHGLATMAIMVWAEALQNPTLASRLTTAIDDAAAELGTRIARLQADGQLTGAPPGVLGHVFIGMLPGFLLQLALSGPRALSRYPAGLRSLWPSH